MHLYLDALRRKLKIPAPRIIATGCNGLPRNASYFVPPKACFSFDFANSELRSRIECGREDDDAMREAAR
jgi:hypothetical protein